MDLDKVWNDTKRGWRRRWARCMGARRDAPQPFPLASEASADGELPLPPERPWGCGWFDSSFELQRGLAVREYAGIELELAVHLLCTAATPARQASAPAL